MRKVTISRTLAFAAAISISKSWERGERLAVSDERITVLERYARSLPSHYGAMLGRSVALLRSALDQGKQDAAHRISNRLRTHVGGIPKDLATGSSSSVSTPRLLPWKEQASVADVVSVNDRLPESAPAFQMRLSAGTTVDLRHLRDQPGGA